MTAYLHEPIYNLNLRPTSGSKLSALRRPLLLLSLRSRRLSSLSSGFQRWSLLTIVPVSSARSNGVKHTTSAPYHPASNGLAERADQIVKKGLKMRTTGSVSYIQEKYPQLK